jgi:hypothetical protein
MGGQAGQQAGIFKIQGGQMAIFRAIFDKNGYFQK